MAVEVTELVAVVVAVVVLLLVVVAVDVALEVCDVLGLEVTVWVCELVMVVVPEELGVEVGLEVGLKVGLEVAVVVEVVVNVEVPVDVLVEVCVFVTVVVRVLVCASSVVVTELVKVEVGVVDGATVDGVGLLDSGSHTPPFANAPARNEAIALFNISVELVHEAGSAAPKNPSWLHSNAPGGGFSEQRQNLFSSSLAPKTEAAQRIDPPVAACNAVGKRCGSVKTVASASA